MSLQKTHNSSSSPNPYVVGDVCSFRTSPATEVSPRETGRYAALKMLGIARDGIAYVVLDGIFSAHPTLEQASKLPWLRRTRFTSKGDPACGIAYVHWENDLQDFRVLGNVPLTREELELLSAIRSYGPLSHASVHAEGEWRWRHDRSAYEREIQSQRQAQEARIVAEQERYEKRLKGLTWEKLLEEQPFQRWDEHPPFPPPDFTAAAREQVRSVMLKLQALGPKPKKAEVRAVLRACVEWFNAKDDEYGGVVETEEREDICALLEELAFVARQRSLVDEVESWRTW